MSDLEKSIADWWDEMFAAEIKSSTLDELEIHLREEIERQINLGMDESGAFDFAVQKIGRAEALKAEFEKVREMNLEKPINTKLKPLGVALAFGAIIAGVLLQVFTNSFVSFHRNGPIATVLFHWPVLLAIVIHFAGLVCLAWPVQRQFNLNQNV